MSPGNLPGSEPEMAKSPPETAVRITNPAGRCDRRHKRRVTAGSMRQVVVILGPSSHLRDAGDGRATGRGFVSFSPHRSYLHAARAEQVKVP